MRVLLVDDQAQSLALLTHILKDYDQGLELFRAPSASIALDILAQKRIDLVLSDWHMPHMDGLAFVQQLQNDYPLLPVILMSGVQLSPLDMRTAFNTGAWDYLRKPFESVEVIARVENVLRLSRAHQEIAQLNESKNIVFNALSNHLITGAQRSTLAMDLIQRNLPIKSDYLERLLTETAQNEQKQLQLLQELLQWTQVQFETLQTHSQVFALRPFLAHWTRFMTAYDFQLRMNTQLEVLADPQMLQQVLENILTLFSQHTLRLKAESDEQQVYLHIRSNEPLNASLLAHWPLQQADNLSREALITYLRMQSCQSQLKAMQGTLSVNPGARDQRLSLLVTLPAVCKA